MLPIVAKGSIDFVFTSVTGWLLDKFPSVQLVMTQTAKKQSWRHFKAASVQSLILVGYLTGTGHSKIALTFILKIKHNN